MRTKVIAALFAGTAAVALGTGTAAAQSAPVVVGMSQQSAVEFLTERGVPFTITNRSGNLSGYCAVTAQRDKGYRTEVDFDYDHKNKTYERSKTEVWRGIGLTVVCR